MKRIWQLTTQHPFSVFFYIIYLVICCAEINRELAYRQILREHHGEWPHGVREWTGIGVYFFGFIFLVVTVIVGSTQLKASAFYLWLALAIILPMVIFGNM